LKLSGLSDEQIEEAVASAMVSVGASTFLHGTGYSPEKFKEELGRISSHMKEHVKVAAH